MKDHYTYSDSQLVTLLKQKDTNAYSFIIEKYSAPLYGLICKVIPGNEYAPAVLKESFLAIVMSIDHYDAEKSRLFTWLLQTTRETALKKLSELKLRTSVMIENEQTGTGISIFSKKMNAEQRELIHLSYFKGFSFNDMASRFNTSEDIVRTKLKIALSHLNSLLK